MCIRDSDDHAGTSRTKEAVYLDARDADPPERHELVDGDSAPLVERQAGYIAESDARRWIVLGDVPGAGSGDVKELRHKKRVRFIGLRAIGIGACELREQVEKLDLGHRSDS